MPFGSLVQGRSPQVRGEFGILNTQMESCLELRTGSPWGGVLTSLAPHPMGRMISQHWCGTCLVAPGTSLIDWQFASVCFRLLIAQYQSGHVMQKRALLGLLVLVQGWGAASGDGLLAGRALRWCRAWHGQRPGGRGMCVCLFSPCSHFC
jgi:hypothetical protein